jgi:hypothetical protein
MFGRPLELTLKTDQLRRSDIVAPHPYLELCLGRIDFETKLWGCVSRDGVDGNKLNTLKTRTMEYFVDRPGTYAVIYRPLYAPRQKEDAYMGIILLNKRVFIGIMFFGIPLFIILIGAIIDTISFEHKCKDVQLDRKFLAEQVKNFFW